ncbi:hypothetical protein ACFL20_13925 [Spirochaetota bacterium]
MKKLIIISIIINILLIPQFGFSVKFDELDKPPEGAHQGQMLVGAFVSLGSTLGSIIDAENDFIKNNTYTFSESEITKRLMVTHLSISVGVLFEYMPIDYLGVKTKLKSTSIVQRTVFGHQFENWTRALYVDFSFNVGPSVHVTNRKQWDFTLTPVIGYAVGEFTATPIANKLIKHVDDDGIADYDGSSGKIIHGFTCGAELNFIAYFSGGLFISLGFDWTMNMFNFSKAYNLTNPISPNGQYFEGGKNSNPHTLSFIISSGYAFSN